MLKPNRKTKDTARNNALSIHVGLKGRFVVYEVRSHPAKKVAMEKIAIFWQGLREI